MPSRSTHTSPTPLIQLKNVSTGYGDHVVLQNLSLDIAAGKYLGIVGPSGSGKTTILKTILGIAEVTVGEVKVLGQKINGHTPSRVGYVPQLSEGDRHFPVTSEQVVLMGLHDDGNPWPWATAIEKNQVDQILSQLGIAHLKNRHVSTLSGGQKQRVYLARALVREPRLLLLDEPTNGIDVKSRHDLLHLLTDLNKSGMTIIITTHDLNAVAAHLPWIICFNKTLVAQGPPARVFNEKILSQTYDAPLTVIRHTGVLGQMPFVTEAT